MTSELKEALTALQIAVDEAEGWYDDARGLSPGERLEELAPCYGVLEAHGLQRLRDKRG